ncbi:MAG: hypothetical protein E6Q98_21370 [Rhodospirillaceae bacterium]|nr:MAG: hypothetical protein E6Q98_21370 [Rhodospirillaceae bacterium]
MIVIEKPVSKATKRVMITQSNYIPWKGYFDLIALADELILLDSVQFTRRDWRNRNIIKTPNGPLWLTIPVEVKGRYHQAIDETRIAEIGWVDAHIRTIQMNYKRAAYFKDISPWLFESLSKAGEEPLLAHVNEQLIRSICARLFIETPIRRCTDILDKAAMQQMDSTERLLELCRATNATDYISGPAARDYLNVSLFNKHGIDVGWADYSGYPEYPQLWGAFDHRVSIVDLLLNMGQSASSYMHHIRAAIT